MGLGKKQGGGESRKVGKSRSGSETRKRGPKINFRVTDDEQAQVQANADRAGLTVGSYARSRTLKQPTTRAVRRAPVETAQLAQLLGLLGAAGGELQRLARTVNEKEHTTGDELKAAIADFRAAASAILRTLGKRA